MIRTRPFRYGCPIHSVFHRLKNWPKQTGMGLFKNWAVIPPCTATGQCMRLLFRMLLYNSYNNRYSKKRNPPNLAGPLCLWPVLWILLVGNHQPYALAACTICNFYGIASGRAIDDREADRCLVFRKFLLK